MLFSPLHTFFQLKTNTACFSNMKHVVQACMKEGKAEGNLALLKQFQAGFKKMKLYFYSYLGVTDSIRHFTIKLINTVNVMIIRI